MLVRLFVIATVFCTSLNPSYAQENYAPNELLIQLHKDVSEEVLAAYLASEPLLQNQTECLFPAKKIYRLRLNDADPRSLEQKLKDSGLFEVVQVNHLGVLNRDNTPDDGNLAAQWYLRQVDAFNAWDISTGGYSPNGDTIVIAVVDEGFDINHLDLNFFKNLREISGNGIDDDGNGYIDDYHGWNAYNNNGVISSASHGSMVAGIAGAIGNNREGIAGINWDIRVMPVLGLSSDEATVVKAYSYVYEMRSLYNRSQGDSGAYVVVCNSSFGIDRANAADYPLWCGMYESMGELGILNVAATANWNQNVDIEGDVPTTCPSEYLIAVTSTDRNDLLSSSPGAGFGLQNIDIGAPGVSVFSTTTNSNYTSKSGTSYAAPMVSGTIALMHSALCTELSDLAISNPDSLALVLREYLLVDGVDRFTHLSDKLASGGRLNLQKALSAVKNCYPVGLEEEVKATSQVYPNPNAGHFQVLNNSSNTENYRLFNASGILIEGFSLAANEEIAINIETSGLYLLIAGDHLNQKSFKIVVY